MSAYDALAGSYDGLMAGAAHRRRADLRRALGGERKNLPGKD